MITEDYVSFEIAKLLKEKGFKGLGDCFYERGRIVDFNNYWWRITPKERYDSIQAPTLQMAIKWLRDVHRIFIEVNTSIDLNGDYHYSYTVLDKECKYLRRGYTDFDWKYEQAIEAALKYALENLI